MRNILLINVNYFDNELFTRLIYPNGSISRKYAISTHGRVFNVYRNQFIKPHINRYSYVSLNEMSLGVKNKPFLAHRLVAIAFIENPLMLCEVNHKDLDKLNNHYTNLEWVSRIDNMYHAIDNVGGLTMFNTDTVEDICIKMTMPNWTYESILDTLIFDVSEKRNVYSLLIRIYKGHSYRHISKNFMIRAPKVIKHSHSDDIIHFICHMITNGIKDKQIVAAMSAHKVTHSFVQHIRYRRRRRDISDKYKW